MTKEEWEKIADWWGTGVGCVKMTVDGHNLSLYNSIDKKKMTVEVPVYVDGYIKSEWSDKGSEIGGRFWQKIRKPMYTSKELKERAKTFGKRSKYAQQLYYEYNQPCWRSFNVFKKHITAKNKDIELLSCGWEANNEQTA